MNKNDLVTVVAEKATITKAQATSAVDAVFDAISSSLQSGDEVRLVGFGSFVVSERKATTGRNPATGAEIQIPASKQAKFKPGKGLKDSLNPAE
jgi:DNA-binding protein HU-beta